MLDRLGVRGALGRGAPIEVVVEDGFDRTVGPGADVEGTLGGRLQTRGSVGPREPDDAQTCAKALLGMWARFEDQFAQRGRRWPNPRGVFADAIDRPTGVTAMAGRHVLGRRRVLVIAAGAPVGGDPFALEKHLDGSHRHSRFDISADEAIGHAVIMVIDLDVIVDADAAFLPFRELVGLSRQGFQRRTIDLFQQLSACHAEPTDRSNLVEMRHEIGDRRVDFDQAVKDAVAQPPQQPSLDDQHRLFDFRFVARALRPGWQNGGPKMRRHLGICSIDLRIVEAGLDDRGLRVVRHDQFGNAADRLQRAHMGVDPIGKRLRPTRMREGEARRAQHGDEDLRLAQFPRAAVDHDGNPVARVVDEQPLARPVCLPHRRRQLLLEPAIEFAKPGVAVTVGLGCDIFVPDDLQRDVLAFQLAMLRRPIRLRVEAMSPLASSVRVKRRLQFSVADAFPKRPGKPGARQPAQCLPDRGRREAETPGDLACRHQGRKLQANNLARLAHRHSFRWHRWV